MELLNELWKFIWAVVNNWSAYATGGLVMAFAWLYSSHKDKPIPRKLSLAFAVIFLFGAFFKAWQDQYELANSYRNQLNSHPAPQVQVVMPPINIPPAQVIIESDKPVGTVPHGYLLAHEVLPDFSHIRDKNIFRMTVVFKNNTTILVKNIVTFGMIAVGKKEDEKKVREIFAEELKKANDQRNTEEGTSLGPNESPLLSRLETPQLNTSKIDDVFNGKQRLYILSWARWKDQNGAKGHINECWWASDLNLESPKSMMLNTCDLNK